MRLIILLPLTSVAHGAVIKRQSPSSPPSGLPTIGDLVGTSLQSAGDATQAAGKGVKGTPGGALPAGILESVGNGLSSAGQAAKESPIKRQAVGDVGGIIGGALISAGTAIQSSGKDLGDGWLTALPAGILESIGAGFISAGKAARGSTGNPRLVLNELRRRQTQLPTPADIVGSVGSGLQQGAAGAPRIPGSDIVGQVGSGLEQGSKGSKDSPELVRRQLPTLGDVISGGLQAAGGITSTVGAGLGAAAPSNADVGNAGGIVSSIGDALTSAGGSGKGVHRRQVAPGSAAPGSPADLTGGALQSAGGITSSIGEGLQNAGPLTAPAGGILEGIGEGLTGAGDATKGTAKSPKRTAVKFRRSLT